jgi:hypothetical protein
MPKMSFADERAINHHSKNILLLQVKLSLAVGINQYFPGWLSPWVTELSPSIWLKSQIDRISRIICHDDALLLEEGHDLAINQQHSCASRLTDTEVMDACLMRGLPVTNNSVEERRECLTNHLKMIASVKQRIQGPITEGFRLFTLHLAPLRYHLKMTTKS